MSKIPSDATKLRHAQRELKELLLGLNECKKAREIYRIRATKAEQECMEWKARFDVLLRRDQAAEKP
jgi:hypothetical protein